MGRISMASKRTVMGIAESEQLIYNALDRLTKAFVSNPNYMVSNKDWKEHYDASHQILGIYKKANSSVVRNKDAVDFLINVRNHIAELECYRDLGLLVRE